MPLTPATQKIISQAMIPMWDSSDPRRNPAPLPLNPRDPASPVAGPEGGMDYDSAHNSSREGSPVRRNRVDTISGGSLNSSPTRALPPLPHGGVPGHKRNNSIQPSPTVREMQNLILSGGKPDRSPTRNATPTPRELFGSSTSFPSRKEREKELEREKEAFQREYSSDAFRKALDFDRTPNLPPLRHSHTPDMGTPTNTNALTHVKSLSNLDDTPTKMTVHDFHTLSSQLSGITSIATTLQREMANLSRRSKDNATDLMSLKEAAKNRDEDIRRSLRDLQSGLTSFEATDRLLEAAPRLSLAAPSHSSGSDSGRDSTYGEGALLDPKTAAASTQALERILREMPTKDDQDHALHLLQDIQDSLKTQQKIMPRGDVAATQEKILSVLEDIKEREDARGKELVISGSSRTTEDDDRVIAMLADLRDEIHVEKEGEQKILSMLEEIKDQHLNKETEGRSDEKILEALDELKGKEGGERIEKVATLLEELKDRETDARVVPLIEEVLVKMDMMSDDLLTQIRAAQIGGTSSPPAEEIDDDDEPGGVSTTPREEIVRLIREVKEGVDSGADVGIQVKQLLENWQHQWHAREQTVTDTLEGLLKQMGVYAAEQRTAIQRIPHVAVGGLSSQALTTVNPPLPPDLDNEAAITALANIASTTTRTDITLSSINALIKVFQKENYSANTNTAEALGSMSRFLEELGSAVSMSNAHYGDVRKILEVVRTGICSGNDRLVQFEGSATRQIEELTYLQKHLQTLILGGGDEVLWKRDLGVKDDVEELSTHIDELSDKHLHALRESSESAIAAINSSNPAELISELKSALGAMAQRSLDAFKNSEDAIQQLKEESANSAERHIEAIQNADPTEQISDFRTEFKDMAERTFTICERIEEKSGSDEVKEILSNMKQELSELVENSTISLATDSTATKAAMAAFGKELPNKLEDIVVSAIAAASMDEKTIKALEELKVEVSETLSKAVTLSEKPDESWKILEPIAELRREITDMIEKSNTALAAPVHYPEAEAIKSRIEILARDLGEAMEKTADTATEAAVASTIAEEEVRKTITSLRNDIGEMGSSIAAAVASNSATAVEEGMKGAFEDMKETVLVKVEQGLVSTDKAIIDIAHLSTQTKDAIERLKEEVMDMVNKSISMAVATVKPDESGKNKQFFEALKSEITDVIITSVAAGTGSDELKELIEGLKVDIDAMGKQVAAPAGPDATLKNLLETMKTDIEEIVSKTPSTPADSDTKLSVEELRKEVREMMEKTSSMIAPVPVVREADAPAIAADSLAQLEEAISNLKVDVNDMVEKSLAAAIANSTFDSEENVKEAIEELKRDVKDTLEKSMVPIPQQANDESARMVRDAMGALRQEIAAMLDKKSAADDEDKEAVVNKLDSIKADFGDLLANSANVEVKEAVEVLKIQVHGLLERSLESDNGEIKEMIEELKSQLAIPVPSSDTGFVQVLEDLKVRIAAVSSSSAPAPAAADEELKESIDTLRAQMKELLEKPADEDLKAAVETLQVKIEGLPDIPAGDNSELKEAIESLKVQVAGISVAPAAEPLDVASLSATLKTDIEGVVEKSTANLSKFDDVLEVKMLVEEFRKEFSETMEKHLETVKGLSPAEAIESLKLELKTVTEKSLTPSPVEAPPAEPTAPAVEKSVAEDGVKNEELKEIMEDIRREMRDMIESFGGTVTPLPPISRPAFTGDAADLKETVTDVGSAVGECRVEVAVVKVLVEEKSAETNAGIADFAKTAESSNTEIKGSISAVKDVIDGLRAESIEGIASVKVAMQEFHESGQESITTLSTSTSEIRKATEDGVTEIKSTVNAMRDESKDCFEEVHKTVEGAQVEIKEAVVSIEGKLDIAKSDIKETVTEVKAAITDSHVETKAALDSMSTGFETSQSGIKEEVAAVKKLVEEVGGSSGTHHDKTQKQVEQVIGLVDGLQSEWKGSQPTLFNALLEMKHLLQEAKKAAEKKPEIELPPPYDDSQTQDKLNQLIAGTTETAKHLPQLDLLDSIQKQVSATSADITEFLAHQKNLLQQDASAKIEAARKAEIELEKAISEKKLVEAATDALREEYERLQINVELLKEDSEELRARKLRLTGEVGGLETALNLRQEELLMIEARGEALERRMLDGIIEQSRLLLMKPKGNSSRLSRADKDAAMRKVKNTPTTVKTPTGTNRRHLSLSQIANESPTATKNKSGRASLSGSGTIGLGQKEPYSASLGLLGRSQSLKSNPPGLRKSSVGKTRLFSGGKENDEREPAVDEGEEGEVEGEEYPDEIIAPEAEDLVSEDEGSVVRVKTDEEEDEGANLTDSMRLKSRSYPALGLDFSDGHTSAAASRNVSGVSSVQ
ncbi:hypothetical protein EDC01DRAFT_37908 [Geopyxis carbonaria]|nr:hypothetical protein EDC01DRAFT_37908 [Geopyxis carbonaria]